LTLAWAQLERQTLRERTQAGMQRMAAEGKPVGRPCRRPLEDDPRWPRVRQLVREGTLTRAEAARRLRVRYETLSAALRRGSRKPGSRRVQRCG
ncbi:MAG: recombinase family protein, partial [Candidatus Dormibacteraeota bacterium]|nr:recombinase family protein [Candidatus Dormibacteraeota bacterium]